MERIAISIEALKEMVARLENQHEHHNMSDYVYITMNKHPNGREYVEFEQPCEYRECNSHYERFDTQNK